MALRPNEYRVGVTRREEYSELKWQTEPPTKDGIYFAQERGGYIVCVKVKITRHDMREWVEVWEFGNDDFTETRFFSDWLGPLPVPEPPKE